MSGIYIPGLSVPEDKAIAVVVHPDGTAYTAKMVAGVCTEYLKDCVAIPVPDHGGLVDLKAPFCAQYYDEMTEEWVEKEGTVEDVLFGSMVYDMPPVVIPADKEGEG